MRDVAIVGYCRTGIAKAGRGALKPPKTCSARPRPPTRPGAQSRRTVKKYARVETLKIIAKRLSSGVDLAPAELDQEVTKEARELLQIDLALLRHQR